MVCPVLLPWHRSLADANYYFFRRQVPRATFAVPTGSHIFGNFRNMSTERTHDDCVEFMISDTIETSRLIKQKRFGSPELLACGSEEVLPSLGRASRHFRREFPGAFLDLEWMQAPPEGQDPDQEGGVRGSAFGCELCVSETQTPWRAQQKNPELSSFCCAVSEQAWVGTYGFFFLTCEDLPPDSRRCQVQHTPKS